MKAVITKTGKYVGYRWQVGRLYSFTLTRTGAIYAARRCADNLRQDKIYKETAKELEV